MPYFRRNAEVLGWAIDMRDSWCRHVNDGKSLEMVPDGRVDFIFSFDSPGNAEDEVVKADVGEFAKKLRTNRAPSSTAPT